MTTPHRTLLQQALDALESVSAYGRVGTRDVEQAKLQQTCTALREALAAPTPAAPVPDGMVMVPREPTEDMIQAAAGAWGESEGGLHNAFAAALRGGIAASPAAPSAPVVPLTDEQKQRIHNETGAGHSLICLVESYIRGIGGGNG